MLSLAPKEEKIAGPRRSSTCPSWRSADGTTFLGTGHGGKIYRIGKDGKAELYFQAAGDGRDLPRPGPQGGPLRRDLAERQDLQDHGQGQGRGVLQPGRKIRLGPAVHGLRRALGGGRRERRHLPDLAAGRGPDVLQGRREPHPLPGEDGPRGRRRRERRQRPGLPDRAGGPGLGPVRVAVRGGPEPGPGPRRPDLRRGLRHAGEDAEGRALRRAGPARRRGLDHGQRRGRRRAGLRPPRARRRRRGTGGPSTGSPRTEWPSACGAPTTR